MNISFTSSGLTNSAVVDSTTGQLLFELSTPLLGLHRNTTLRDAQNNVIGVYKRGTIHDEVTYQGRTMRVSEWLLKNSVFSSSDIDAEVQLVDCQTGELVANAHSKKLFSTKKMNMDVVQNGLPILDAIVLSFLICELRLRREQDAANAAAAGASG
ncbi:hypothetical protein TRAPUB_13075 [Trametes pubescens]|uniref:DUF6593 domain-containing protein n=1 Tax=Trametes pubescens TaxID=154538 RepID=A0A1M2VS11_TRAPU|nr:hypothetical protein TRAPUB_13075 [Trametes pubescens]